MRPGLDKQALDEQDSRTKRVAGAEAAPSRALSKEASEKEDSALMLRFKKGEAQAFERLLKKHRRAVYNFCLRMLGDQALSEDAMQEVFLRVVKASKDWERQAKFTTWLYTIARNHCVDLLRKGSYRQTASLDQTFGPEGDDGATLGDRIADDKGISPDRGADSLRLRAVLHQAIAKLPEEQREVFLMREQAGLSFKEIAAVVGAPENTVKSRMRYALEQLRTRLLQAGFDGVSKG